MAIPPSPLASVSGALRVVAASAVRWVPLYVLRRLCSYVQFHATRHARASCRVWVMSGVVLGTFVVCVLGHCCTTGVGGRCCLEGAVGSRLFGIAAAEVVPAVGHGDGGERGGRAPVCELTQDVGGVVVQRGWTRRGGGEV